MGTQQEYLDQAHRAARDLAAAVGRLDHSLASATDLRQPLPMWPRTSEALDEITGRTRSPAGAARPHDTDYDPSQFADGSADLPSHARHS